MRALWRLVAVCLVVLAQPLQGLAAVTMLHCVSAPPAAAEATPCHEAGEPMPGHDLPAKAADGQHHCSACAACFAGAALPVSVSLPATPDLASPFVAHIAEGRPSFIAGGLERPPRTRA